MEHHGAALRSITGEDPTVVPDRAADLDAILVFAEKLTLRPWDMRESDLVPLREAGLDDRAILEVVEIVAYFNLINRMAAGLGVSLEPERGRIAD